MRAELGSRGDSTAEPEEQVEDVEDEWQERVEGELVAHRGWDEVEEGEHAEDGDEEVVIDDAVVAAVPLVDHVARERHDEEGPEELSNVSEVRSDGLAVCDGDAYCEGAHDQGDEVLALHCDGRW